MKKLLIIMLMVIGLGACTPSHDPYDDTELENRVSDLELRLDQIDLDLVDIAEDIIDLRTLITNTSYDDTDVLARLDTLSVKLIVLEDNLDLGLIVLEQDLDLLQAELDALALRLDNITVTTGLNGQVSVYENDYESVVSNYSGIAKMVASIEFMKDTFDKSKAPSYIVDVNGDYISFEQLSLMLKAKYFSDEINSGDLYQMGSMSYMQILFTGENDINDLFAKAVLMIEELRTYPFYIISSSEIQVLISNGNNMLRIKIPLVTMLNDYFEITLEGIYSGDYEMKVDLATIDLAVAQSYYDYYKDLSTFDTPVLGGN